MDMNMFIYYGTEIDKHDYENMINKLDIKDFYSRIYGAGLQFREVGNIDKSWKYVIGKELYWDRDNMINFKYEDGNIFIDNDNNIKLNLEDESEIRKKLLQIGITNIPAYKIFNCWI